MTTEGLPHPQRPDDTEMPELEHVTETPEIKRGPLSPDLADVDIDSFLEKQEKKDEERDRSHPPAQ